MSAEYDTWQDWHTNSSKYFRMYAVNASPCRAELILGNIKYTLAFSILGRHGQLKPCPLDDKDLGRGLLADFSGSIIFDIAIVLIRLFESQLYLTGATAAELRLHLSNINIYIIITKNVRYFLWNRGLWRSLNNTYPTFLTPCIRCTNHLCDSCDLIDVNPHFIPSLLPMIQNADLLWRHRYKSGSPAIVTSQWLMVSAWVLWTLS